jgi:hypothetical protein
MGRSLYYVRRIATRRRDKEVYILRIEHPVADYDAWKAAFDSDPIGRERSGVKRYRIMRAKDDPSQVMIDLEFDSLGEAEAVKEALGEVQLNSASEAEAARAALEDPTTPLEVTHGLRVRINEVVETKEY